MKTRTINIYSFDELSETSKARALDRLRETTTDYDWGEFTVNDFIDKLALIYGFYNAKVYYNGFYSQGDGASFSADADIIKFISFYELENKFSDILKEIKNGAEPHIRVTKSGNYEHSGYMSYDYETGGVDNIAMLEDLVDVILDKAKRLADEFYKELQAEYEYLISNESIIETIEANEWEFLEDGTLA